MDQQIFMRKEWHEFFVQNRDRFTDSKSEVEKDKTKIYVGKSRQICVGPHQLVMDFEEDAKFEKGIEDKEDY